MMRAMAARRPQDESAIELEPAGTREPIASGADRRPRIEEPLPVRLVAIADVTLPAQAGQERELDDFYCRMLEFVRVDVSGEEGQSLTYQADNFALRFVLQEGLIERQDYRPTMIEVRSLAEAEQKLIEREIEYTRQKGVAVGYESLLLQDPAGNWIELVETKELM